MSQTIEKIAEILAKLQDKELLEVLDYLENEYWQINCPPPPPGHSPGIVLGRMPDHIQREIEKTMRNSGLFPDLFKDDQEYDVSVEVQVNGVGVDFENVPVEVQRQVSAIMHGDDWEPPQPPPKSWWARLCEYVNNR